MNAMLVCWDNIPNGGNGIKTFLMVKVKTRTNGMECIAS